MNCAWVPLWNILPDSLRNLISNTCTEKLQEIRLRCGYPPEMNYGKSVAFLPYHTKKKELQYIVNAASKYSPWTVSTISSGYITIPGGHRIGLCGQTLRQGPNFRGIQEIESLNIRISRDISGIGADFYDLRGSVLILGAPGWGKTTLLRDLCRNASQRCCVTVIDEREELFPEAFARGPRMDVLSLCGKPQGVEMALRTMGPELIAVDEITAPEDCEAILQAANCGVRLMATAHGSSLQDLHTRRIYQPLMEKRIFDHVICLNKSKHGKLERSVVCSSAG